MQQHKSSNWRVLLPERKDPYSNLELEEILFNNFLNKKSNFVFRFWKSTSCCVVGRHQYIPNEINIDYCRKNNIPIIRRISGGGAVFLDMGCLNYSIIFNKKCKLYSENILHLYKIIITKLIEALSIFNLDLCFIPPNSIYIDNKKISGSAQFHRGNSVLHHGTLLLNSDLETLKKSLTPDKPSVKKRSVKSKVVDVTNLFEHINTISENDIIHSILDFFESTMNFEFFIDHLSMKDI